MGIRSRVRNQSTVISGVMGLAFVTGVLAWLPPVEAGLTGRILIAGYGPELPLIQDLGKAFEKSHPGTAVEFDWDRNVKAVALVRAGTADMTRLGGLVGRMPVAAGLFFVAAAALVGLPGSMGFVADELLMHAALSTRPWIVAPVLLATGLNAITLYRAYTSTFLGRPRGRSRLDGPLPVTELAQRERWALVGLLALTVAGGVFPQFLLGLRKAGVSALLGIGP